MRELVRRVATLPERRVVIVPTVICLVLGVLGELQNHEVPNTNPFDLDAEQKVAATWSAGILLAAAAAAFGAAVETRIRSLWGFGAFVGFMGVDEYFEIHEELERQFGVDWQILYLPVFAIGAATFLLAVRRLRPQGHHRAVALLFAGAACWVVSQVIEKLEWDGERRVSGYRQLTTVEELLEMFGSLLFGWAMLAVVRAVMARERDPAAP